MSALTALSLAQLFHAEYERFAPQFGYETRPETREFNPESQSGRLMNAVCEHIIKTIIAKERSSGWQLVPREPPCNREHDR